uniref:Uncharacterized protein n=1 Tax=Lepeophtheirus salmonis TaxID=72036 RepID=A0A0K2T158_LEPSM
MFIIFNSIFGMNHDYCIRQTDFTFVGRTGISKEFMTPCSTVCIFS